MDKLSYHHNYINKKIFFLNMINIYIELTFLKDLLDYILVTFDYFLHLTFKIFFNKFLY